MYLYLTCLLRKENNQIVQPTVTQTKYKYVVSMHRSSTYHLHLLLDKHEHRTQIRIYLLIKYYVKLQNSDFRTEKNNFFYVVISPITASEFVTNKCFVLQKKSKRGK